MPLSTIIHNVEITPSRGGQLVKATSFVAKLIAKGGLISHTKITFWRGSYNISRLFSYNWPKVGHIDANNQPIDKAGSKRWLSKRP
jgi:large subunit ribosomal protein L2